MTAMAQVNNLRWTMSGEIESYLNAIGEAEKAASKIRILADRLETVGRELIDNPNKAIGLLPTDWPSREQIAEVVVTFTQQIELAQRLYSAIPVEMRRHISGPPSAKITRPIRVEE